MIHFSVLSGRFFLKRKTSSDARVVPITKKNWFCSILLVNIDKVFKVVI